MAHEAARGRILVAEDNEDVSKVVAEALAEKGYEVLTAAGVGEAKGLLNAHFFDLALVDLNLGSESGFDICRHVRTGTRNRTMPIIILTGQKGLDEMTEGIESGADYFLTKPLAVAELYLWVRALLRRVHRDWDRGSTIGVSGLRINPDIRTVWVDREVVRGLTSKELDILLQLALAYPSPHSTLELFQRVWGRAPSTNTLAVHVMSLRRKLGLKGGSHVVTVPDGYRLQ